MNKTILVVDDDPLFLELVTDVLKMQQHHVVAASNGEEALTLITRQHVDVVVSDIEMPVMNGISFHQQLLKNKNFSKVPFIFLTATEDPDKVRYVREHPPAMLLRKENVIEELLPTISKVTAT